VFRRDIEGLRAIAVGMVLLHHAHFLGLDGGFIGVDVFFVVSGFLITGLLLREHADTGRISIPSFYARRARRILPASAAVIVATALGSWYWLDPLRVRQISSDVIGSGGFFANIVFAARSTDYLQADSAPSPLQHFWSLSVEEQFYIVWPALLLVLLLASRGRRRPAAIALGVISVASFVVCVLQTRSSQPWAFFGLHTRAWELGVGALLALGWTAIGRVPRSVRAGLGWGGLATVVASAFLLDTGAFFPGWLALLPVLGTAAVIAGGDDHPYGPTVILRNRPMQWIGSRSYSLYLWHWPALIIAEGRAGGPLNVGERIGAVLIACGAAELSYRLVENPIRHARMFNERTRPALGLGVVLVATSILAGVVLRADSTALATDTVATLPVVPVPGDPTTTVPDGTDVPPSDPTAVTGAGQGGTTPVTTLKGADSSDPPSGSSTTVVVSDTVIPAQPLEALEAATRTKDVPRNLEPSLGRASGDKPEIYDNGCHRPHSASSARVCEYGDVDSDFTVALYGDSHAAQWFDAIDALARKHGWRLLVLSKSGCPVFDRLTYNSSVGPTYPSCRPWRRSVLKIMEQERVSVAFVTNSNRLLDSRSKQPFTDRVVGEGLDTLIAQMKDIGVAPVLFTDTPYPGQAVPNCLARSLRSATRCVASRDKAIRQSRMDTVIRAAERNSVQYLDVEPWVCTEEACPVILGNLLMYRDSNHLTTSYVKFLTPLLEASLAPYVNGVRARR